MSCKDDDDMVVMSQEEINIALTTEALDRLMIDADETAIDEFWSEDYRQHNPIAPNGSEFMRTSFITNRPPNFAYQRGLTIAEGDFVMTHNIFEGFTPEPLVTVDVYKIENSKIAAHWDVLQTLVPADSSVNGNPMFPIEYTEDELTSTVDNKTIVETAIREAFTNKDISAIDKYWAEDYIQHNPTIPNGREAIKNLLANVPFTFEVGFAMQMGDFVFLQSRVEGFGPEAMIAADIFRVKDGILVQHWDVLQAEVPADQTVSGNAMFPIQ